MAWTEDVTRRGRSYKVFVDGLGHGRLFTYGQDVHYFDDALVWQDVDESFVDETTLPGTFAHQCVTLRHGIHIGTNSQKRWMPRRNHPLEYINFGRLQYYTTGGVWSNLNLGTPVRSANTLTWDTANFTLKLAVIWRSVKIEAVLKNSNAAKRLRWSVTLSGLTWSNWTLISNSDSTTVGTVRRPKAWDANGSSRDPNITITPSYSGGYIEFTGDLSTAVYPVTIDPTLDVQPDVAAGCDNFTYDGGGNSNYGTDTGIEVYHWNGTIQEIGLIKFDLSGIPGDATIDDATLTLYAKQVGNTAATTHLHRILAANTSWTEAGSTWNHAVGTTHWAGDAGGDHGADAGCSVSGTDFSAVLLGSCAYGASDPADTEYVFTLDVDEIATMVDTNYGNIIWQSASTPNSYITYKSSDHADATKRPHLVINYTLAGGTTYEGAITLAKSQGITEGAQLNAFNSIALGRAAGVAEGSLMDAVNTLTLGRTHTTTASSLADLLSSITLGKSAGVSLASILTAENAVTMAIVKGLTTIGGLDLTDAIALGRLHGISTAGIVTKEEAIALGKALGLAAVSTLDAADGMTLAKALGISAASGAELYNTITLAKSLAAAISGGMTYENSISLAIILGAATAGTVVVISAATPEERIYLIDAENRVYEIKNDYRTYKIPAENRTYKISK